MFELEHRSESFTRSLLEGMLEKGWKVTGWDKLNCPFFIIHHSVFCIMGSATKVSGQIRLRLLYSLF
jgi:hypothetical protein